MKTSYFKIFTLFISLIFLNIIKINAQVVNENDDDSTEVIDEDYVPVSQKANTVSGRWYGIGNVVTDKNTNSYLCELILTEKKGGLVTGFFNYFFRDGYFSVRLKGSYKKDAQQFQFNPLIVLFHQTTKAAIGVDVAMSGNFFLNVLKTDTVLTGFLMPTKNYRYLAPPINVKFSKLPKDAPSLKQRIKDKPLILEGTEEEIRRIANGENVHDQNHSLTFKDKNQPKGRDQLHFNKGKNTVTNNTNNLNFSKNSRDSIKNDTLQLSKEENTSSTNNRDSLQFTNNEERRYQNDTLRFAKVENINKGRDSLHFKNQAKNYPQNLVIQQNTTVEKQLVDLYKSRKNNIAKDFVVKDDSVTVQLYDNGEYDKDVVSVFFNGKVIVAHKELSTRIPIKFVVQLSKGNAKNNELTLFADNLGEIPPNSALMIVTDTKGTRFEVNLDSDFNKNASILLKVQD